MKTINVLCGLGVASLLLVAQPARRCANPYYTHGTVFYPAYHCYATKPPFKAQLEPLLIDWMSATGVVRYGMTIPEIKEALAKTGGMCGMVFKVSPFELKENGVTYHAPWRFDEKPPPFHGKPFIGKYFTLSGKYQNEECYSISIIATRQGRAAFILYLQLPPTTVPSIQYLPGDRQTEEALRKIQAPDEIKYLDKWLALEKQIVKFLHEPHSLEEVQEFFPRLFPAGKHAYWKTSIVPYENDDWGVGGNWDHLYCIRGAFKAKKTLILKVDDVAGDYCCFFNPKWDATPYLGDGTLHAYFNGDDELVGVSMRVHMMAVADPFTGYLNQLFASEYIPNNVLVFWRVPPKGDSSGQDNTPRQD